MFFVLERFVKISAGGKTQALQEPTDELSLGILPAGVVFILAAHVKTAARHHVVAAGLLAVIKDITENLRSFIRQPVTAQRNVQFILVAPRTKRPLHAFIGQKEIRNLGDKPATGINVSFTVDGSLVGSRIIDIATTANASILWNTAGFAGNKTVNVSIERSAAVSSPSGSSAASSWRRSSHYGKKTLLGIYCFNHISSFFRDLSTQLS